MVYLSDVERNYKPHRESAYLIAGNVRPQRFLFGEPVTLEPWEVEQWERFQQWVADKGLRPIHPMFKTWERWGFTIMYLYGFSLGESATEE
jgi:hypothetical protein